MSQGCLTVRNGVAGKFRFLICSDASWDIVASDFFIFFLSVGARGDSSQALLLVAGWTTAVSCSDAIGRDPQIQDPGGFPQAQR